MDIGTHLREAREKAGLSLRDVAETTKLSPVTLRQIERNEFGRLPGGIFVRGYLRSYAETVGADPGEMVSRYLEQYEPPDAAEALPIARPTTLADTRPRMALVPVLVLLAVAAGAYGLLQRTSAPATHSAGGSVSVPTPIEPLVARLEVPGSLPGEPAAASYNPEEMFGSGLRLEIEPAGDCWVSAMADGQVVLYQLLQGGERVNVTAQGELVLRVGDPQMFVYTLNGEAGRSLGSAGEPVTVTITGDNYEGYLAPAQPTLASRSAGV